MSFKITTIANFIRDLKYLAKKYPSIKADVLELSENLIKDPFQGDPLGKDCYKVRMKITSKGQGKSGGARVITCVKVVNEEITLMAMYDKSVQGDISDSFLLQLLSDNGLL